MQGLLEKRGIIKHDVAKLIRNYINVFILCESKDMHWKRILKSFGFIQNKTTKTCCIHLHSWLVCVERHTLVGRLVKRCEKDVATNEV